MIELGSSGSQPLTVATTPAPAIEYATASQKEEIIRLLNHPVITRPEKTKILLNINRFDEERANTCIGKLRKAINDRENGEVSEEPIDYFGQNYTFTRLHQCASREGRKRSSFYKKLVTDEKMSQKEADEEIALMYRIEKMMALLATGKLQLVIAATNSYYAGQVPPL